MPAIQHHDRIMILHRFITSGGGKTKLTLLACQGYLLKVTGKLETLPNVRRTLDHVSGYEGICWDGELVWYETKQQRENRWFQQRKAIRQDLLTRIQESDKQILALEENKKDLREQLRLLDQAN